MEKVRVRNVEFGYNGVKVLRNVSLRIDTGHVVSLLGPNGSGKTTLLKVLLGLYRPERGEVSLEGRPMREMTPRELARKIAYVPQTHNMSFAYSVMDVVLMGRAPYMSFFSRYSREDKEIALHALERLSITNLKDRVYTELSGGERQLVLIGRALTQGADTLVMDEPPQRTGLRQPDPFVGMHRRVGPGRVHLYQDHTFSGPCAVGLKQGRVAAPGGNRGGRAHRFGGQ